MRIYKPDSYAMLIYMNEKILNPFNIGFALWLPGMMLIAVLGENRTFETLGLALIFIAFVLFAISHIKRDRDAKS